MTFSNPHLDAVIAGFSFIKILDASNFWWCKFFLLLISVMNFFLTFLMIFEWTLISCFCTLSIRAVFGILSSFSQVTPQNYKYLFISGFWPSCSLLPSTFLNKFFFWYPWKFKLFLILYLSRLVSFCNFLLLYLNLWIYVSLCLVKVGVVGSVSCIAARSCVSIVCSFLLLFFFVSLCISHCWLLQF